MAALINLQFRVDDAKGFDTVRRLRWPESVRCARCGSDKVARDGHDDRQPERQRYRCTACQGRFDDLSDTIFAGHHQPLRIWILCLYFMGLNLSNQQIARELDLNAGDVQAMTEQLRVGILGHARPKSWPAWWSVTRSTSPLATRASRQRWRKKSLRAPAWPERPAGPRHLGEGEAPDLRHG